MPQRSERLPVLLYAQPPLLLKQHDDHHGSGHREVNPVELIIGREGKWKKTVTVDLVTMVERQQCELQFKQAPRANEKARRNRITLENVSVGHPTKTVRSHRV